MVILKSTGYSVVAQDAPVVVLDPFVVALRALGTPMVALDFSMVALGLSGFSQGGSGFLCGLWVPPWWPWVSVNPPCWPWKPLDSVQVALEPFEVILCVLMLAPEPFIVFWWGVKRLWQGLWP